VADQEPVSVPNGAENIAIEANETVRHIRDGSPERT
jgi:hypothetical protein